jgi:hypothetical protein
MANCWRLLSLNNVLLTEGRQREISMFLNNNTFNRNIRMMMCLAFGALIILLKVLNDASILLA